MIETRCFQAPAPRLPSLSLRPPTTAHTNWRGKTANLHGDKKVEDRLLQLKEAVTKGWLKARDARRKYPLPSGQASQIVNPDRPLYVFSAPEWLFRKSLVRWNGEVEEDEEEWQNYIYTKKDRDAYCAAMEALSKPTSQADVLMVAGTFHWAGKQSNPQVAEIVTARVEKYPTSQYGEAQTRQLNRLERKEGVKRIPLHRRSPLTV